jgi:hypothetical protein
MPDKDPNKAALAPCRGDETKQKQKRLPRNYYTGTAGKSQSHRVETGNIKTATGRITHQWGRFSAVSFGNKIRRKKGMTLNP